MNLKVATKEDLAALAKRRGGKDAYALARDIDRADDEVDEREAYEEEAPYGNCTGCGVPLTADEVGVCVTCAEMDMENED